MHLAQVVGAFLVVDHGSGVDSEVPVLGVLRGEHVGHLQVRLLAVAGGLDDELLHAQQTAVPALLGDATSKPSHGKVRQKHQERTDARTLPVPVPSDTQVIWRPLWNSSAKSWKHTIEGLLKPRQTNGE